VTRGTRATTGLANAPFSCSSAPIVPPRSESTTVVLCQSEGPRVVDATTVCIVLIFSAIGTSRWARNFPSRWRARIRSPWISSRQRTSGRVRQLRQLRVAERGFGGDPVQPEVGRIGDRRSNDSGVDAHSHVAVHLRMIDSERAQDDPDPRPRR